MSRSRAFDPSALKKLIDQYDQGVVYRAAKRTGVSQPTLWNIIQRVNQPTAETLDKIARAYGVTTDWLYTGQGRAADDTFGQGVLYAVTHMRRELDQLEATLGDNTAPLTPPPVGSLRDRAPVADPELFKAAEPVPQPGRRAQPKKPGKKRA